MPDSTVYKAVGIPPDVLPEAELLPLLERELGIDSWLEVALEMAREAITEEEEDDNNSAGAITVLMSDWIKLLLVRCIIFGVLFLW